VIDALRRGVRDEILRIVRGMKMEIGFELHMRIIASAPPKRGLRLKRSHWRSNYAGT
jgi:hypothetical protein